MGWNLIWQDEFEGAIVDSTKWDKCFYDGARWGYPPDPDTGQEWQYYTDEDVYTEGGYLRMRAQKREYVVGQTTWHYTSGMLSSALKHFWLFGKFEARIRMPRGVNGFWPAFWMCANPDPHTWPPEIDIMEQFSLDDGYYTTWDYPNPPGTPNYVGFPMHSVADVSVWHVYGVEWSATAIKFTLDGVEVATTSDNVNTTLPMYLLLNLAVDGGTLNPPHHAPDINTPWPSYMDVDYVRVYEATEEPVPMSIIAQATMESGVRTGQADTFDSTSGIGISISAAAALAGSEYGMAFAITTTANRYCVKNITPPASNKIRYRFYVDPNGIVMANNDAFELSQPRLSGSPYNLGTLTFGWLDGTGYRMWWDYAGDAGWLAMGSQIAVTDAPHIFEVFIQRAATNVSSDGITTWWIDGVQRGTRTNIDNYDSFALLNGIWVGPDYSIDVGTTGTLFLDELLVNDDGTEIGAAVYTPLDGVTTIDLQVGTPTANDGYSYAGGTTFQNNLPIIIGKGGNDTQAMLNWWLFESVAVPNGATIHSSMFSIKGASTDADTPNESIYGNDIDSAVVPATWQERAALVNTTASVNWDLPDSTTNVWYDSPDISAIIQEIVSRPGWVSGASIQILFQNRASGVNEFWTALDFTSGAANAAKLRVVYSDPVVTIKPSSSRFTLPIVVARAIR